MNDNEAIKYLDHLLNVFVGERFHGMKVRPFRMANVPGNPDPGFFVAKFIDEQNIDSRNHIAIDVLRARPGEKDPEKWYQSQLGSVLRSARELLLRNRR